MILTHAGSLGRPDWNGGTIGTTVIVVDPLQHQELPNGARTLTSPVPGASLIDEVVGSIGTDDG